MAHAQWRLTERPLVVGSIGSLTVLDALDARGVQSCCDLAEIRLDLIRAQDRGAGPPPWCHLRPIPLLFTARRPDEGGAGNLTAGARHKLLESVLAEAAWLDVEVASIGEMDQLLDDLANRQIPWIASFHDFEKLPDDAALAAAAKRAKDAGASVFKAAAMLHQPADLARLAEFQLADHGLPVATMGMGPLAAVSRLLCPQCGSVFNYGYLGQTATAPGQWDAALLRQMIARLIPFRA